MTLLCIAFAAGFTLDVVWALCVRAIAERRPLLAANMGVLIYLCTLISTVLIVRQCVSACVAYAVGGWIGTYLTVKWSKQ